MTRRLAFRSTRPDVYGNYQYDVHIMDVYGKQGIRRAICQTRFSSGLNCHDLGANRMPISGLQSLYDQ